MMNQIKWFFLKEWKEAWRNFKWIWVPIVFIALGISDSIMNYYMEDILSSVGNMPEGMDIIVPDFNAADIFAATTNQFQTVGIIVITALFASAISRERQNGTATLLYVRPISFASYYWAKWLFAVVLSVVSVGLGYVGSFYYTSILYGTVPLQHFFAMVGIYMIWIVFVISFSLCMSAWFKTAIAMTISIIAIPIGIIIDTLIGTYWTYSPWKIGLYAQQVVAGEGNTSDIWVTCVIAVVCIALLSSLGIIGTRKNRAKLS
jgi:ABC-2 type transport system permease protein